jgi:RNA-directed DNA polymerase
MKSSALKVMAIDRICQINAGRYTAGIDGVSTPTIKAERLDFMTDLFHNIDINKEPEPIRRVYIPKPNGKQRPLGIPTITDRIIQEIIRQSIEPICEYHFNHYSHGFRPKRSCHDATADLFIKLSRASSKQWIIEGDIKGCFDHISHDHIIETLKDWRIPNQIYKLIHRILKSNISLDGRLSPSEEGTPQGGVISPMLANVALTCLDNMIQEKWGYRDSNPIVRYADDFIILAENETQARQIKEGTKQFLKNKIGLELSSEKTRITHITEGFDFLGFNFRKYGESETLLIKPSRKNTQEYRQSIKQNTKDHNLSAYSLIKTLNPVTLGWGNYYRHVVSQKHYDNNDAYLFHRLMAWANKKHPTKGQKWIVRQYFTNWIFYDRETGIRTHQMQKIPIRRHIKVQRGRRVYCINDREYWNGRTSNQMALYGTYRQLYDKQYGKCAYCEGRFTTEDDLHLHHLKPLKFGGVNELINLRLIHHNCHTTIHGLFSLIEMNLYADKGIDYLTLLKG